MGVVHFKKKTSFILVCFFLSKSWKCHDLKRCYKSHLFTSVPYPHLHIHPHVYSNHFSNNKIMNIENYYCVFCLFSLDCFTWYRHGNEHGRYSIFFLAIVAYVFKYISHSARCVFKIIINNKIVYFYCGLHLNFANHNILCVGNFRVVDLSPRCTLMRLERRVSVLKTNFNIVRKILVIFMLISIYPMLIMNV